MRKLNAALVPLLLVGAVSMAQGQTGDDARGPVEYRVLATSRTSTMEKELNEAAAEGFRFEGVMGGETAFGGSEVVSLLMRGEEAEGGRYSYRLLATSQTATMQEEMREAGRDGYSYRGQTVYSSLFGGDEVVVIMERDEAGPPRRYDYQLLATSRTSTLETELNEVGQDGFRLVGITVGETAFGGDEVVVLTERIADN
tara:strand:+ start:75 stop:671 length:597 start_codon:yes stop_codon:yes gene_type:complete